MKFCPYDVILSASTAQDTFNQHQNISRRRSREESLTLSTHEPAIVEILRVGGEEEFLLDGKHLRRRLAQDDIVREGE